MIIKGLIEEDLVNYKLPSMTILFPYCTFKCGAEICQNNPLIDEPNVEVDSANLVFRYINNSITEAVVMQGLEPFDSYEDIYDFINELRKHCNDNVVIYTGYNKEEIEDKISQLSVFKNIIVKFGRYIPGQKKHFDTVLGVSLASDNQYGEAIS